MHTTAKNRSTNRAATAFAAFGLLVGLTAATAPFPSAAETDLGDGLDRRPRFRRASGRAAEPSTDRANQHRRLARANSAVEPLRRGAGADRPRPRGGPRERVGDRPGDRSPGHLQRRVHSHHRCRCRRPQRSRRLTGERTAGACGQLLSAHARGALDRSQRRAADDLHRTRRPDSRRRLAECHHGSQPPFPDRRGSRTRRARESGRHHGRLHHRRRWLHERRQRPMARRARRPTAGRSCARVDRCRQCRHRRQSHPERRRRSVHRAELAVTIRSRRARQAGRAVGHPAAGQQRHQRHRHARHAEGSRHASADHRGHADAHRTRARARHRRLGRHDAPSRRACRSRS